MDLRQLPRAALAAALRGGTGGWGQVGSSTDHVRYALPRPAASRRRCSCGCGGRATHSGMANGVCLVGGCEMGVARWVKTGSLKPR